MSWSERTDLDEVRRRCGGRRRYNAMRSFQREARRAAVSRLLLLYGSDRGVQSRVARELGVHRSTVSRDVRAMELKWREWQRSGRWPPRAGR
jgi:hypothetical protein